MKEKISSEALIKFGFKKTEHPLWPFEKVILGSDEEGHSLRIVVTVERNTPEFALLIPGGDQLYLNIPTLDHLEQFVETIQSFEPF